MAEKANFCKSSLSEGCTNADVKLRQAYISGHALVILEGPHQIAQTIYNDDGAPADAVDISGDTGKIAVGSRELVHIYVPYGQQDDVLKVHILDSNSETLLIIDSGLSNIPSKWTAPSARHVHCPGELEGNCWSERTLYVFTTLSKRRIWEEITP